MLGLCGMHLIRGPDTEQTTENELSRLNTIQMISTQVSAIEIMQI